MNSEFENLLSPFYIGKLRIKNRLTVAPMGDGYLSLLGPRGEFSWQGMEHCIERAKGGFGLFVSGCILYPDNKVEEIDPISSSMDNKDLFIKQGLLLNERCAFYDMKVFQQITMGLGRNWGMMSCSANPAFDDPTMMCGELTNDQIKKKIDCVISSAKLMQAAGFAGVEVHALHWGYLLDQFAMSITNHREDEYGGCLENRLRVCREIVDGIKSECGADYPVSMRLGLKGYIRGFNKSSLDGSEEAGRTLEEGIRIAQMLENYGYDVLNVDVGMYDSFYHACPPIYMPQGHVIPLAAECKKAVNIPVICGSRMNDPHMCEKGIAEGSYDAVAIGRPSLADPDFAKKIEMGVSEKIRPCIGCLVGCMGKSREGAVMTCAVNPRAYLEDFYGTEKKVSCGKVVVVGGGISGMEAARAAKERGFEVAIYEKSSSLGGVLALSAKQHLKEELSGLVNWYIGELKDVGVSIHTERTLSANEIVQMHPYAVIIATGGKAIIPEIEGADLPNCVTALDVLSENKEIGDRIVVIGGGLSGCELAIDLSNKGKTVTIVEANEQILENNTHVPIMVSQMMHDLLPAYGVQILTGHTLKAVNNNGAVVVCGNEEKLLLADNVVYAVGIQAEESGLSRELHGEKIRVYSVGNALMPGNAYTAIHSAYEIARNL